MAKYRVLPSAARNYGASFISVMNVAQDDYAMCYLLRAAKRSGIDEFRVNLLTGITEPASLVSPELHRSMASYSQGFGGHIEQSGSALEMVSSAEMRIRVAWGRVIGKPDEDGVIRARLDCVVSIVDDRGRRHEGS